MHFEQTDDRSHTSETQQELQHLFIFQTLFHQSKVSLIFNSQCIGGHQPTETKMASIMNTVNTI